MDRTEGSTRARGLPLTVLAAIDAVPHHTVIAYRPAFVVIDKLNGMQGRVVKIPQVGRTRRKAEDKRHRERCRKGSHGYFSSHPGQ
jgi:hypothetical protein